MTLHGKHFSWWLVDRVSCLLDEAERAVVCGDLAECRARAGRALREVLGLVIRRQAALWIDWHPWLALASLVIPIGLLLSHASRSWGMHLGVDVKNYWTIWDFSYLAYPAGGTMSFAWLCGQARPGAGSLGGDGRAGSG